MKTSGSRWPAPPDGTVLEQFAIYDRPLDFPDDVVVRRWFVNAENELVPDVVPRLAKSVDEARRLVPGGLARIGRSSIDDPAIVETWL